MRNRLCFLMWIAAVLLIAGVSMRAQWLHEPTADAPRTRDGKVDLTGRVPRLNGKPDLSGLWQVQGDPRAPGGLFGLGESLNSRYFRNVLADSTADEVPLTPAGAARLKQNLQPTTFNPVLNCLPDSVPHGDLLPEPFKIVHSKGVVIFLYEVETTFRQVFTDGRKLPVDPEPAFSGYSVGKWDGDSLVVEAAGFKDNGWLDAFGHPHSGAMRLTERFRRLNFGTMEVQVTVDDPKNYVRPITIKFNTALLPDTDLLESFCENEKDRAHMPR